MSPTERNAVIEEIAVEIEHMRLGGQKYHWWGAFWNVINEPLPHREKVAALVRSLKAQPNS